MSIFSKLFKKEQAPSMPPVPQRYNFIVKDVFRDIPETPEDCESLTAIIDNIVFGYGIETVKGEYIVAPQVVKYNYTLTMAGAMKAQSKLKAIASAADMLTQRKGCRCYIENGLTIEVPRGNKSLLGFRSFADLLAIESADGMALPCCIGTSTENEPIIIDLAKAPHLLIAGATGSGKSVCLNDILISMMGYASPSEVRFIMIDPKQVELMNYSRSMHLAMPICTTPWQALNALRYARDEMERRYTWLAQRGFRNLEESGGMYRLVVVIDELANLILTSKKETETLIETIAAKGRAAGVHLIVATQNPTVKVITGRIKANIPTRIAFATASITDSRVILDYGGAEKLTGAGDGLFKAPNSIALQRFQSPYLSDEEIRGAIQNTMNMNPDWAQFMYMYMAQERAAAQF